MIMDSELEDVWTWSGPTLRYSSIFLKGMMETIKNMYVYTGSDTHHEVLVTKFN
jgi:hypothetical protein